VEQVCEGRKIGRDHEKESTEGKKQEGVRYGGRECGRGAAWGGDIMGEGNS
jgi:hypothetical protein